MIIELDPAITTGQLSALEALLPRGAGSPRRVEGTGKSALVVEGRVPPDLAERLKEQPGVSRVLAAEEELFFTSRRPNRPSTVVVCADARVGSEAFVLAAGPCAVESEEWMDLAAAAVKAAGGTILRGGSFKPRTSPYSFQGLGEKGLAMHRRAADRYGLVMMSEVLDREDLPLVASYADILQVGSRNMQNFPLLKALGKQDKPVFLKRGLAATREEFLLAAEYILAGGNGDVILCERGVRSFDPALRNTLDLASVCLLREMTHLPVMVDPSHATGYRKLVLPMARAAAAVGADGIMVEVHPDPPAARSDGPQALLPEELKRLAADLHRIAPLAGKTFPDADDHPL